MEAVVGPEALVEVAVGDVDEGDAATRADGGGGLDASIEKAKRILGYNPQYNARQWNVPIATQ